MPTILLTASRPIRDQFYPPEALDRMRAVADVELNDSDAPLPLEDLIARAQGCEIVVADRQTPGPAAVFEGVPGLLAFVRTAVDISTIDVPAASANGVLVTHATPGFAPAVAEWTLGAMIDLARGITQSTIDYRAGGDPPVVLGRQLAGSVLGVIGFGAIGRELCKSAKALGMRVRVADPYVTDLPEGLESVSLADLLAHSDFVVCLAVANAETENMMDAGAFHAMRRGAFFINPSRGNLVDEAALTAALDTGHLGGAALDVGRAPDQKPSPALAAHPLVVATPHIGGLTPAAVAHQALESAAQCAAILAGEMPPGAVNPDHAKRLMAAHGGAKR